MPLSLNQFPGCRTQLDLPALSKLRIIKTLGVNLALKCLALEITKSDYSFIDGISVMTEKYYLNVITLYSRPGLELRNRCAWFGLPHC